MAQKKVSTTKRILDATRKHISRNKWLSVASIVVISLTFMIATTFTGLIIISNRTITYLEKKAQVIIFFNNEAPEELIFNIQKEIEATGLTESIEYISKEEALEIYARDFEDDPALVESVTSEALPPSLNLRAKDIEEIPEIIKLSTQLRDENAEIDEVMYFKDVIDSLRSISGIIKSGGLVLILALSSISIVLILITIGFNINAHKHEIEVMKLIGSTDQYIRVPFILEGAFYGLIGAVISISITLLLWYGTIYLLRQSDLFFFVTQLFQDIGMPYLKELDPVFLASVISIQVLVGAAVGAISSMLAIWKYLK